MLDMISSAPTNPTRVSQPTVVAVDVGATAKIATTTGSSLPTPPVAAPSSPATVDVRTAFPSAVTAPDGDARVEAQVLAGEEAIALDEAGASSRAAQSEQRREELAAEERRRAAERILAGNGLVDDPERPLFGFADDEYADSQQAEQDGEDLDDLLIAQTGANSTFLVGAHAQAPITEAFIAGSSLAAQSAALDLQA